MESYVLGEVSPQEKQEVECLSSIYPEVKEALQDLQVSVEKVAEDNAIEPPKELKEKVLSNLYNEIDNDLEEKVIEHDFTAEKSKKEETKGQSNTWKLIAAACFVLFLIATTVFINTRSENQLMAKQVDDLQGQVKSKGNKIDQISDEYASMLDNKNNLLAFLSDTNTRRVALKGTDLSSSSLVNVFWNQQNERVVLHVDNLPSTPTKKQYQLWAIVDGKPKDMGVLTKDNMSANFIEVAKTTGKAAAFAITLEEEGGKPEPDLDQLYVIGNV